MQERLYGNFWHSTCPPCWWASLAAYYQLITKSQMHMASLPPDAKGNFCVHSVNDGASVLGCVVLAPQDILCATLLLPLSPGWSLQCCSPTTLLFQLFPASYLGSRKGGSLHPQLHWHLLWLQRQPQIPRSYRHLSQMTASLFLPCHYDRELGGEGIWWIIEATRNSSLQNDSSPPISPLVMNVQFPDCWKNIFL